MPRASLAATLLLLALPSRAAEPDAGRPGADRAQAARPCPDPALLESAEAADWRLRESETCAADDLAVLVAAARNLDACEPKARPAVRWVFPVANIEPPMSIGGVNGSGYQRANSIPCYATRLPGHPAHDLFVHDWSQTGTDRNGDPFPALAVEDGFVLVARAGWQPGDAMKGGNYVMLYLPGRKQVAYYAHLDKVFVKAGERVAAGQVLGTIGRTGKNAWPKRSQTHLHFGLWDTAHFRPINSYSLLRSARPLPARVP